MEGRIRLTPIWIAEFTSGRTIREHLAGDGIYPCCLPGNCQGDRSNLTVYHDAAKLVSPTFGADQLQAPRRLAWINTT
jgi:hypothetical protein